MASEQQLTARFVAVVEADSMCRMDEAEKSSKQLGGVRTANIINNKGRLHITTTTTASSITAIRFRSTSWTVLSDVALAVPSGPSRLT